MLAVFERALRDLGPTVDQATREDALSWFSGAEPVTRLDKWTFKNINDEWQFDRSQMDHINHLIELSKAGLWTEDIHKRVRYG